MDVLLYDNTFEGFLTCVFEVYERKLKNARIEPRVTSQPQLLEQATYIAANDEKAQRVWKGVQKFVGEEHADVFWKAWLSEQKEREVIILGVLNYLFSSRQNILSDYGNSKVQQLQRYVKQVAREKHRMEAFVRFQLTTDGLYYALIEPDYDVLPLIISHFESRYADQLWLIYDLKRDVGIYYDLEKTTWVNLVSEAIEPNISQTIQLHEKENLYQALWQKYFQSTNIASRKNTKLHIRHVPKRYWKYLTEKKQ